MLFAGQLARLRPSGRGWPGECCPADRLCNPQIKQTLECSASAGTSGFSKLFSALTAAVLGRKTLSRALQAEHRRRAGREEGRGRLRGFPR
jgi:hypothetical protein